MKLIVCILQDSDKENVTKALTDEGFQVTVLPSSGGYFRRGNSTLLIGADKVQVDQAIEIIKQNCKQPDDPGSKRATVFVLNVAQHEQI